MRSQLTRSIGLLIVSIVLWVSLPRVQATPPPTQSLVYLPIVQQPLVLVLSEPVGYNSSQYWQIVIGDVVNVSATQAFSVTLRAIVYHQSTGITETLIFPPVFPVIFPSQGAPFFVTGEMYGSPPPIVSSLSLYQVVPTSASTIRPLTVIPKNIGCPGIYSYGYITGSVRNDNTAAIMATSIVAWSLRSDSSRGYGQASITEPLAPGAEQAFSTSWFPALCPDGRPYPDLSLNFFQYAAQGTVLP
jgi:hypothetical protein